MKIKVNSIVTLPALTSGFFRVTEIEPRKGYSDLIHLRKVLEQNGDPARNQFTHRCCITHAEILTENAISVMIAAEKLNLNEKEAALKLLISKK